MDVDRILAFIAITTTSIMVMLVIVYSTDRASCVNTKPIAINDKFYICKEVTWQSQ